MASKIVGIYIATNAGDPMRSQEQVNAIAGCGLDGDRYEKGLGSFNKGKIGNRQVTFIQSAFFKGSGFKPQDSRRNVIVEGDVELYWLIGREFQIGTARFRGVKYCDPCNRPSKLSHKKSFKKKFFEHGGIVAEVIETGSLKVGDELIPPPKGY